MAQYPLTFTTEDGDIVVRSRDFPELLTAGTTQEEAEKLAADALAVVIDTYAEKGMTLPEPSQAQPGDVLIEAKYA